MKNLYKYNQQSGMTLIEIMIALIIGAFLIGGILQIFLNSQKTYKTQDNLSRLQENGRFAMEFMSRDIRMADYWGCTTSAQIQNKLNADPTFDPFRVGLASQDNDNGGNDGDADNDENGNDIRDGTDSITVRGASGLGISLTAQDVDLTKPLSVTGNSGLSDNDFVLISDCISGDIFQITKVTAGTPDMIEHGAGNAGKIGNSSVSLGSGLTTAVPPEPDDTNAYDIDSQIYKLNFVTYQIQDDGAPGLYRQVNGSDFEELIEGIEDLQIDYGVDTDADGTANYYIDSGVANMAQVVSVRINLTARTLDNNLTTTGDGRLRRTFSSTIVLRNRLP